MKRFYKVFTKVTNNYCYCYSKKEALESRASFQALGLTKVMIKGSHA